MALVSILNSCLPYLTKRHVEYIMLGTYHLAKNPEISVLNEMVR